MARPKKDGIPVNTRLNRTINERLDKYCEETGATKTFVIEKALTVFLDRQEEALRIARKLTED